MNFLYVLSCTRKSEQFLVSIITPLSELQLRRTVLAGYAVNVLMFVPSQSIPYLERVWKNLHIEGFIVPKDKPIELSTDVCHAKAIHAKVTLHTVEINWEELVKAKCLECTLVSTMLQQFPIPVLFIRHAVTGKACSLPADVWFTR